MPVIRVANNSPRPSRLNDSDNPSDGAHGSSTRRPPPETALSSSLPKSTASRAGQAASIPARCGNRLTSQAAGIATTKGERMKKPITAVMLSWTASVGVRLLRETQRCADKIRLIGPPECMKRASTLSRSTHLTDIADSVSTQTDNEALHSREAAALAAVDAESQASPRTPCYRLVPLVAPLRVLMSARYVH